MFLGLIFTIFLVSILIVKYSDQFAYQNNYNVPMYHNAYLENDYENVAIATIATGGYSAHNLITSLRKTGKWDKNIYVYTDFCSPNETNVIELKNKGHFRSINSKLFKMDILKNTTEDYILYLDSDIKTLDTIDNFFQRIGPWKNICDVYLAPNMWYSTKKFIWNGGVIFAKRYRSEKFLNLWKKTIQDTNYRKLRDRSALKYVIESGDVNVCLMKNNIVKYAADISGNLDPNHKNPIFSHYVTRKTNVNKCV